MKTYITPSLTTNGTVVRETLKTKMLSAENAQFKPISLGDVGFYL